MLKISIGTISSICCLLLFGSVSIASATPNYWTRISAVKVGNAADPLYLECDYRLKVESTKFGILEILPVRPKQIQGLGESIFEIDIPKNSFLLTESAQLQSAIDDACSWSELNASQFCVTLPSVRLEIYVKNNKYSAVQAFASYVEVSSAQKGESIFNEEMSLLYKGTNAYNLSKIATLQRRCPNR